MSNLHTTTAVKCDWCDFPKGHQELCCSCVGCQLKSDRSPKPCPSPAVPTATGGDQIRALINRKITGIRWDTQGGYSGFYDGKWAHGQSLAFSPEEMATLCEFAGVKPDEIIPLGECRNCIFSENGQECGWRKRECVHCQRPRMSNFKPMPKRKKAGTK